MFCFCAITVVLYPKDTSTAAEEIDTPIIATASALVVRLVRLRFITLNKSVCNLKVISKKQVMRWIHTVCLRNSLAVQLLIQTY